MRLQLIITLLFSQLILTSLAQSDSTTTQSQGLDGGTLDQQFDYIIDKSNRYQDYKVVKRIWIDKLRANVDDSLQKGRTTISGLKTKNSQQAAKIESLQTAQEGLQKDLDQVNAEKDSMVFFGQLISKSGYNLMVWVLIFALIGISFFLGFKFKQANAITTKANAELLEIQNEFESFRKKSREKEQKLKRELQDEINKRIS